MPRNNPAAPPATGPIIRLTVQVTANAQLYEVILDYMGSAPLAVNQAVQTAFLSNWRAQCETQLRAVLPTTVQITSYFVAEVAVGVTPTFISGGLALAGTVMANPLPGTVAAVLTKFSSLKGQHGRGRAMLMAVPVSFTAPAVDPNVLVAGGITAYTTLATQLLVPVAAGGINFGLSVSTRPIAPLTVVTQAIPVTSMVPQAVLGNVRRRREGRGI